MGSEVERDDNNKQTNETERKLRKENTYKQEHKLNRKQMGCARSFSDAQITQCASSLKVCSPTSSEFHDHNHDRRQEPVSGSLTS